jgi:thioredoxin-like negative regulator of GroEL
MQEIKHYNEIDNIINQELVMIIAKTHTCSTCTTINHIIEQNVKYIHELPVYYIYVDDIAEFRGEYTIFSVPTVLIFNEGKEILRESKFINFAKIDRLIDMFNH